VRTITIYICSHGSEPPLAVFPTMKQANQYLIEMQKDHGECHRWRASSYSFNDNSKGAAQMCNWILGECSEMIVAGQNAKLLDLTTDLEVAHPEVQL